MRKLGLLRVAGRGLGRLGSRVRTEQVRRGKMASEGPAARSPGPILVWVLTSWENWGLPSGSGL